MSGMICSYWRENPLCGVRGGGYQHHSPRQTWTSPVQLETQDFLVLVPSLALLLPPYPLPSVTVWQMLLFLPCYDYAVLLFFFFPTWLSVYSVINTEWHLLLIQKTWNLILALPLWTRFFTLQSPSLHICKLCGFDYMRFTISSRSQSTQLYQGRWETRSHVWRMLSWLYTVPLSQPTMLTCDAGKCFPHG